MDKLSKIIIAVSILLIALSVSYYFVVRPISKDNYLKQCLHSAQGSYQREQCYKQF